MAGRSLGLAPLQVALIAVVLVLVVSPARVAQGTLPAFERVPCGPEDAVVSPLAHPTINNRATGLVQLDDHVYLALFDASTVIVVRPNATTNEVLASGLPGPAALALDALGQLYVALSRNGSVARLDRLNGTIERVIAYGMAQPWAIAFDDDGALYIADRAVGAVYVLDRERVLHGDQHGHVPTLLHRSSLLQQPEGIAVTTDAAAPSSARKKWVLVTSRLSGTLVRIDATNGTNARPLVLAGLSLRLTRPEGLSALRSGSAVFVSSAIGNALTRFDLDYTCLVAPSVSLGCPDATAVHMLDPALSQFFFSVQVVAADQRHILGFSVESSIHYTLALVSLERTVSPRCNVTRSTPIEPYDNPDFVHDTVVAGFLYIHGPLVLLLVLPIIVLLLSLIMWAANRWGRRMRWLRRLNRLVCLITKTINVFIFTPRSKNLHIRPRTATDGGGDGDDDDGGSGSDNDADSVGMMLSMKATAQREALESKWQLEWRQTPSELVVGFTLTLLLVFLGTVALVSVLSFVPSFPAPDTVWTVAVSNSAPINLRRTLSQIPLSEANAILAAADPTFSGLGSQFSFEIAEHSDALAIQADPAFGAGMNFVCSTYSVPCQEPQSATIPELEWLEQTTISFSPPGGILSFYSMAIDEHQPYPRATALTIENSLRAHLTVHCMLLLRTGTAPSALCNIELAEHTITQSMVATVDIKLEQEVTLVVAEPQLDWFTSASALILVWLALHQALRIVYAVIIQPIEWFDKYLRRKRNKKAAADNKSTTTDYMLVEPWQ